MTLISFGKANLLQSSMLLLAGYVPRDSVDPESLSMLDRRALIAKAKRALVAKTGLDFGFDLAAWHEALQANEALRRTYTFPYAWVFVKARVEEAVGDQERKLLIESLEQNGAESGRPKKNGS